MVTLKINTSEKYGGFKPLNATNGGPWHKRHANDQKRSNLEDYKKLRIPYARNHDSAVIGIYGGPYSHDITCIFPDFNADPCDPASYDFECTDEAILVSLDAGTKTFFRLGQTIEHQIKKHGTLPPKDFKKWAVICEHIIRHYTEGWANGFSLDMPYWEIWNEPDLDRDDSQNKRCWGGTKAEFFDLYEIASKHLKACFPHLKIGGPALAGRKEWAVDFLKEMKERNAPLDFFSWHIYAISPDDVMDRARQIRELLDESGFESTESILNEWNYVKGWEDTFIYSLKSIHGLKGASFMLSVICEAQRSSIDMLMYYDTLPSVFNGVFDFYTYERLSGYYPLLWYGMLYDAEYELRAESVPENIHYLCGEDKNGKILAMMTYYSDNDEEKPIDLCFDAGKDAEFEAWILDGGSEPEKKSISSSGIITMKIHSCVLIKEK